MGVIEFCLRVSLFPEFLFNANRDAPVTIWSDFKPLGFETPGPNYRPGSSDWRDGPQKSFGAPLKHNFILNELTVGEYVVFSITCLSS